MPLMLIVIKLFVQTLDIVLHKFIDFLNYFFSF